MNITMAELPLSAEVTRIPSRRNSKSPPQLDSSTNISFGAFSAEVTPTNFQFTAEPPPQWSLSTDPVPRGRALSNSQHSNTPPVYEERPEISKELSQSMPSSSPGRYNGSGEKPGGVCVAIEETRSEKSKSQKTDQGSGKLRRFWKRVLKTFTCGCSDQDE